MSRFNKSNLIVHVGYRHHHEWCHITLLKYDFHRKA